MKQFVENGRSYIHYEFSLRLMLNFQNEENDCIGPEVCARLIDTKPLLLTTKSGRRLNATTNDLRRHSRYRDGLAIPCQQLFEGLEIPCGEVNMSLMILRDDDDYEWALSINTHAEDLRMSLKDGRILRIWRYSWHKDPSPTLEAWLKKIKSDKRYIRTFLSAVKRRAINWYLYLKLDFDL